MTDYTAWEFVGKTRTIDMEDYETSKRFTDAAKILDALNTEEMTGTPEAIQKDCETIRSFFMAFLGEDIFDGMPLNRRVYMDAVSDVCAFVKKQKIADATRLLRMFQSFAPQAFEQAGTE